MGFCVYLNALKPQFDGKQIMFKKLLLKLWNILHRQAYYEQ